MSYKEVDVSQFLQENPGYTSDYTNAFNIVSTAGCKKVEGNWISPDGAVFKDVYKVLAYIESKRRLKNL